jgi:hypothetical protein
MISGVIRFVVLRVFGARVLLVLAILGWLRDRIWPPHPSRPSQPAPGRASSGGDLRR